MSKTKWTNDSCSANTSELGYTCYSKHGLDMLKNIWNKRHPDNLIKTNNSKDIWRFFKTIYNSSCSKESCWLRKNFIKNNINIPLLEGFFAPKTPIQWENNPKEWLDSDNISNVMKQYENEYPSFEFIGPTPIDYDTILEDNECVWNELCKFNLNKEIERGKKSIGIIFNLDKHDKSGSHWVVLYIDILKEEIYFFDSYGFRIHPSINKFSKNVIQQSITSNYVRKFKRFSNVIEHQTLTDSECGVYCLYIIIELVKGADFKKLTSKRIPDNRMVKMRKIYFNK